MVMDKIWQLVVAATPATGPSSATGFHLNMQKVWDLVVEYAPKLVGALVFIIVAYLLSGWIGRLVARALGRAKVEKTLSDFFGSLTRWAIFVMAAIACVTSVLGVRMTSFAAVIGASALAIGLALQGSLSSLAAGVMLLIFRPFKAGDVVSVGGHLGKIDSVDLFNTQIDTLDNRRIIVPNASVFGSTIENVTFHPTRRVDIAVGVEYSADIDETRQALTQAAGVVPGRLDDPPPQVILLNLGNSSVDWQVRVWTNTEDYWVVWDAATKAVKEALGEAGIGIPFPQMDVHLDPPADATA